MKYACQIFFHETIGCINKQELYNYILLVTIYYKISPLCEKYIYIYEHKNWSNDIFDI